MGREVHLASCRLCLGFNFLEKFIKDCSEKTIVGTMSIGEVLEVTGCGVQMKESDFLENVCEQCLVRLDLIVAIRRQLVESGRCFKRMELFIREENRLRYKRVPKVEMTEHQVSLCNRAGSRYLFREFITTFKA